MLNLTTLEDRQYHGDMTEMFRILSGIDKAQDNFLELDANSKTQDHMLKWKKLRYRTQKKTMFSSARIINKWNLQCK